MYTILHRFRLWQLKRRRKQLQEKYAKKRKELLAYGSKNPTAALELQADEYYENQNTDEWIDAFRSSYLIEQAIDLDVETPPVTDDSEFWQYTDDHENWYLSRKGRDLVQDLINKKKDKDSEDWARFARIWVPIIAGIAGLIGTITGLVAVAYHTK